MLNSVIDIIKRIKDSGHQCYITGGYVRDKLLQRPCKDIDLATDATYTRVLEIFPSGKQIDSKQSYPIVEVDKIQIATYRDDIYPHGTDGRHSVVTLPTNSITKDAQRRDFTINALYWDPTTNYLLDPLYQGLDDIKNKVLRFIGDPQQRINEDYLRILRFVRFGSQLTGFLPDKISTEAIYKNLLLLQNVSAQRIRDELTKTLQTDTGLLILQLFGVLKLILPKVERLIGVEQNPEHHTEGDVFTHTYNVLRGVLQYNDPILTWAALLHDSGKFDTFSRDTEGKPTFHGHEGESARISEELLTKLWFPNEFVESVIWLCANHMRIRRFKEMKSSKKAALINHKDWDRLSKLLIADDHGKLPFVNSYTEVFDCANSFKQVYKQRNLRTLEIDGHMVMEYYGLEPGPKVGEILKLLEEKSLDNPELTTEELLKSLVWHTLL